LPLFGESNVSQDGQGKQTKAKNKENWFSHGIYMGLFDCTPAEQPYASHQQKVEAFRKCPKALAHPCVDAGSESPL